VNGLLTMSKRAITITANDRTKAYGEEVTFAGTEFTITSGTLATGDSVTSVTLASEGAAANAAYKAGGYPIVPSDAQGTGLANYEITYANGLLTITKLAITIKATNRTKPYGQELLFVGTEFEITSGELKAGDSVSSVDLESEGAAASAPYKAEGYPIVASNAQGTGLGNYEITYVDGLLNITRAAITIIANDAEKVYGEVLTFDGTEFTVSGELQNGEQVTSVYISSVKAADDGTDAGEYEEEIVPFYPVTGIDTNNYEIAFSNGTLTVTQATLTIAVNNVSWKVGKPRPANSFADFSGQLQADDTVADITGGTGLATDVDYTNTVWNASEPTRDDAGPYADEIWIDVASLDGAKAQNYLIEIDPGDLTVIDVAPLITTAISGKLNWNTGLIDLELNVKNEGDGEVDPEYGYWVELKPGPAGEGEKTSVDKTFYIDSPTGTMPDGYDYVELTAKVKAALRRTGNRDEVFDPGEAVKITGVCVYHWKRWNPAAFINANEFFVSGLLFNEADTNKDFAVSESEKSAAASLLGTNSAAYLEVSRLALLPYYHWNSAEGTWK